MQNTIPANGAGGNLPEPSGGKFLIFAFDYPKRGNSGGWSRGAKHKPQPVISAGEISSMKENKRRKFTAFDMSTTPPTLLRRDYSLEDIRKLGGNIPKLYFDELGNMRGERDELIMAGPQSPGV